MTTITQAYEAVMSLCYNKLEYEDFTAHMGRLFDDTKWQMGKDYEEIPTKEPKPGIADMTWIDKNEEVMVFRSLSEKKVEVRVYHDSDLFKSHVNKIKEIEGLM